MAGETFIGSSGLWGQHSWAHSLIHRARCELEKNNGANRLIIEGTAAFCPLSSLERIRQGLQVSSASSSQSAL